MERPPIPPRPAGPPEPATSAEEAEDEAPPSYEDAMAETLSPVEDLKAAVEMNPDTKEKKQRKRKKTSVSIHAVQQQGGSLLVSTRLIARFISEKPSESD